MKEQPAFSLRLLRRSNPLIGAILRSRFHGLMSREIVLATFTGRKTGREYSTPLSYIERGNTIFCFARPAISTWWKNFQGGARIGLIHRGTSISAKASLVPSSSADALDLFREFLTLNPRTGLTVYNVRPGANGRPDEADLRREVGNSVVVRLDREPPA